MKKRLTILFALSGLVFLFATCNRTETDCCTPGDDTGTLELRFKGVFDDAPLMMYAASYPYEAGMSLRLQLFLFYLSDMNLLEKDGKSIKIKDIEVVNFANIQSEAAAKEGVTIRINNVPAGKYSALKTGIGVSSELNKTNPGNYSAKHPLSDNYWSAAMGYIFTKMEGNADLDNNGSFETKLTFHIGANSLYRSKSFDKELVINAKETTQLDFVVDLRKLLVANEGNFLDFRKTSIDHTTNMEVASFIMNNLVNAIEVK